MKHPRTTITAAFGALMFFGITGCAGPKQMTIKRDCNTIRPFMPNYETWFPDYSSSPDYDSIIYDIKEMPWIGDSVSSNSGNNYTMPLW